MVLLEVNNLKKNFGKVDVLKGVSFNLEKGEVLAIIGSSGSGKTTLLRCLNFLELANGGSFSVNGEILFDANKEYSDKEIREKRLEFGLVFQNFNLFPQYNVFENLTLAPLLALKKQKLSIAERKAETEKIYAKAEELLVRVGLAEKKKAYPCQLSGGQQQRVAIARALVMQPEILCFDEPTSALDPELTGEVLRVIKGLKGEEHTMIVVTHEMEFAKNVADKIIFMADGVIEEMGTSEEVFDNPKSEKTKAFLCSSFEKI
ncbi:MAG: amino acid ABC transporter ATP-binding protein [Clostridia bacterium]|nr:amino acid ABC transporter ATP-binding protein [Clostridia bacterium]